MRGDVEAGYVDGKLRVSLPANISLDGQNGGYQTREQTGSVRSRASPLRTSPPSASGEPQSKNNPLHHDVGLFFDRLRLRPSTLRLVDGSVQWPGQLSAVPVLREHENQRAPGHRGEPPKEAKSLLHNNFNSLRAPMHLPSVRNAG